MVTIGVLAMGGLLLVVVAVVWYQRREKLDPVVEKNRISALLQRSQNPDDLEAMGELALAYSEGIGVPKDVALSEQYADKARTLLFDGIYQVSAGALRSEPKNVQFAIQGLSVATRGGHAKSTLLLAGLLVVGDDVPKDLKRGYSLAHNLVLSATDPEVRNEAALWLAIASAEMSPEEIEEAKHYVETSAGESDIADE